MEEGEIVRDQFTFALNGFDGSQAATVWLGFYNPAREDRMTLSNPAAVKNDQNNRYALADIPIH